jgi:hypothetical protein
MDTTMLVITGSADGGILRSGMRDPRIVLRGRHSDWRYYHGKGSSWKVMWLIWVVVVEAQIELEDKEYGMKQAKA